MHWLELIEIAVTAKMTERIIICENISSPGVLDLVIASIKLLIWMAHPSGANHVQINIKDTPQEVLTGFNGRCMVTILPRKRLSSSFSDCTPVLYDQLLVGRKLRNFSDHLAQAAQNGCRLGNVDRFRATFVLMCKRSKEGVLR